MLEAKNIAPTSLDINAGLFRVEPSDQGRRAAAWLRSQLDRMSREGGFAELNVLVSPALAAEVLKLNTKNRKLKEGPLSVVVKAIVDDRWINTGHPVVISWDRLLQDGQHRLNAVIKTGIPAAMDFRFGIDPRAFVVTDTGTKRTAGDALGIAGYQQVNTIAAAVRVLFAIDRGISAPRYGEATNPTNDVVVQFAEEHPLIKEAARIGHSSSKPLKVNASAAAAAAFIMLETHDLAAVEQFFTDLRAQLNIESPRDPLKVLKKLLEEGGVRSPTQVVAALITAFNRYREGRAAKRADLILNSGDEFPKVTRR